MLLNNTSQISNSLRLLLIKNRILTKRILFAYAKIFSLEVRIFLINFLFFSFCRCIVMDLNQAEAEHIVLVHTKKLIDLIRSISSKKKEFNIEIVGKYDVVYFNDCSSEATFISVYSAIELINRVQFSLCFILLAHCKKYVYFILLVHLENQENFITYFLKFH